MLSFLALRTFIWRRNYPFELVRHWIHNEIREVGPLEVFVDDAYLVWVVDGTVLRAVNCHCIARGPVTSPLAV